MKNEKGEISHFTGMVKDITENVKATQALKESEENIGSFCNSSMPG